VLKCEDKSLLINHNLNIALRYLRLKLEPRTLWVDFLCINQNDIDEKLVQILLMGQIYKSSARCLVWLGEAEYDRGLLFSLVKLAARSVLEYRGDPHVNPPQKDRRRNRCRRYFLNHIITHRKWLPSLGSCQTAS
jgi:hypothetical protein